MISCWWPLLYSGLVFQIFVNNQSKEEDDVKFGDLLDKAKQGSNLMIQKITEYLIRKKRI